MATETIVLEVKSNIKSVTKETTDWNKELGNVNESISIQNTVITDLEKQLIKLKAAEDAIPKGAFWYGRQKNNQLIKETTTEIKLEKNALKELKNNQKEASTEVKKFNDAQKEQKEGMEETLGSFRLFGLSLKGIKKAFKGIIPTAKLMFGTIKAGLISTGIGALLVAFGVLMTWFKKTKVGAEALEKIFAAVGAVVSVIVDRITGFATAVGKLFSGDVKGALTGIKESFTGIGDEMMREAALAIALKQSLQDLADAERALSVETAKRKQEIEELRLKARDLNLTEQERIEALEQAGAIEEEIMSSRVANAEEALRIQTAQMSMSKNMAEDLDKLAELEINLANIRREGATKQRTLLRETDRIRKKAAADEARRQNAWLRKQKEIREANNELIRGANEIVNQLNEHKLMQFYKSEEKALYKVAELRINRQKGFDIAEIEASGLSTLKKAHIIGLIEKKADNDLKAEKIKYNDWLAQKQKDLARTLQDLKDENFLLTLEDDQKKADKEAEFAEAAEIRAVAKLDNRLELEEQIREKYRLQKEDRDKEFEDLEKERAQQVSDFKLGLLTKGLDVLMSGLKIQENAIKNNYAKDIKLAKANGKSTDKLEAERDAKLKANAKKQKALKVGLAIIDTYQSAVAAYAAGLSVPGPAGLVLAPISAALAIAAGLANVAMIMQTPLPGGGGGGGGGAGGGGGGETPAPQMMSGAFELTGGEEPEPLQAYVVSDDITDTQNSLEIIRRRATI